MLEVQNYLCKYNSLEKLKEEFAINYYFHSTLPLVGMKYNMIESPKYEKIVRECRGLVLERDTWKLIAKPFTRFFNYGECEPDREKFDWKNFTVTSKEDGSLIVLYYYDDRWMLNTSGSFAEGNKVGFSEHTWSDLFFSSSNFKTSGLNKNYTYIFELCSLYNKIVRLYPESKIYFLGAYDIKNGYELTFGEYIDEAKRINVQTPIIYNMNSMDEVLDFLHEKESSDPTFEGVVIRSANNIRFKVKNEAYLRLHHMFDNGNVANPKNFVPFIIKGERSEIESYFPELKTLFDEAEKKIQKEWNNLLDLWKECGRIESQKDFALSIIKRTKFSSILFTLRKDKGINQTQEDLQKLWSDSHELITKAIYG